VGSLPSESIGNFKGYHESHELHQAGGASGTRASWVFGFNGLRRVSRHCVAFPDVAERKRRGYLSDQQMTEQLTLEDVEMLRSLALRLADLQSGYPLI